ncbi:MAG: toll/interleukin-1 receptor domain-containing protein [Granulosicoccus sp.]
MEASTKRIFLSYNRLASSGWAQNIADKLESLHSLSVFVDTRRNESGKRISAHIADEIRKADVFICLLGQGTLDSEWVSQEIQIAFDSNKPMIPIFQDDFDENTHGNLNIEHINALLDCDGVPLLNRRGAFYDASIEELAKLIEISYSLFEET